MALRQTEPQVAGDRGWLVKLTLLLTACLTIMAGATIAPSLPGITAAFSDVPNIELLSRLVLTMPALFVVIASPIVGRLADRVGRIAILLGAIVLFGVAGSSGLWLDSLPALLVGRAFLGIGVAGIMTLGTALAGDYFDGEERDGFMGLQQAFNAFGGLVFLTAGGFLAEIGWRWPFAIYALALLLVPLVWRVLTEPAQSVTTTSADSSEAMPTTRIIAGLCTIAFLVSAAFYIIPSQLPYRLATLGISAPWQAGLAIGIMTLTGGIASLAYGRVRARIGPDRVFVVGLALMAAGLVLTGLGQTFASITGGTALTGLGMGVTIPNVFARAMALSGAGGRARTAGFVTASVFLGQFLSPLMSQPIIAAFGYPAAFDVAAIVVLLGILPARLAKERRA